jgi:hypothetical protein
MKRSLARGLVCGAALIAATPALHAQTTQWALPPQTQQVDPRKMDNPDVVARPGPLERMLAGSWELWVPGGVWYSSDGRSVYQHYTPGAAMNRLTIRADGSYQWGGQKGRLVEVRPWFAQEGQRYYAVSMNASTRYMARWDAAKDQLLMFFWGVGGHAATGARIGKAPAAPPASPTAPTTPVPTPGALATAPQPAGNPLGVEWVSSSPAVPAPAQTAAPSVDPACAPNALGVVWAQCKSTTPPAPPAPAASPLVNNWRYASVQARTASGEVRDHSAQTQGTLALRADGSFSQELRIGTQRLARSGRYQVDGERIHLRGNDGQAATLWFQLGGDRLWLQEEQSGIAIRYGLVSP